LILHESPYRFALFSRAFRKYRSTLSGGRTHASSATRQPQPARASVDKPRAILEVLGSGMAVSRSEWDAVAVDASTEPAAGILKPGA
jgi:hypothetical protein